MASAVPTDLSDGVFIAHHDPAIVWSDFPPAGGWCAPYAQHQITSCDQQNPSVPVGPITTSSVVWYVLAQWWDEPKTWCLSEFGFGDFDPNIWTFYLTFGPCTPGDNLEISTGAWPGPNSGTAVTTTNIPWSGNFVPVYYFTGYGYGYGLIPLAPDPTQVPFAGFINCLTPPQAFAAACLPALGVGVPGEMCCSEPPAPEFPCCVGEDCVVVTERECVEFGGILHPEFPDCGPPNPCIIRACCIGTVCVDGFNEQQCVENGGVFQPDVPFCEATTCQEPTAACCVCEVCSVTTEQGCIDIGGVFYPDIPDCDPNPCTPSPTDNTSWGNIKAIYR